jgi:tripartite-type tricarboxylate transporter receptor subunit TctC
MSPPDRETAMQKSLRAIAAIAILEFCQAAAMSGGASAQAYPSRTITIVVPYPAGGPTDTIARVMAERMKAPLGQSVIVENVTGAGGSIGTGRVARSAPDGYTLSIGHNQTHVLNGAIQNLNYDVVKDFEPIALIADTPIWIIAKKALPPNDLKEFVAWLKAQDGKATNGAVGIGGPTSPASRSRSRPTRATKTSSIAAAPRCCRTCSAGSSTSPLVRLPTICPTYATVSSRPMRC